MFIKRITIAAVVVATFILVVACGSRTEDIAQSASAVTTCPNDPGFGTSGCYQGDWWIEFSVTDHSVTSIKVEVQNTTRVVDLPDSWDLGDGHVKFYGGPNDGPVSSGTMIRLTSTSKNGTATTNWFAYMTGSPVVTCGDGGSSDSGAMDAGVKDATVDATVDVTVDATVDATADSGVEAGKDAAKEGGTSDGGTTTSWSPYWQQTQYAGSWWAEFTVQGGGSLPVSVSLEVVGGTTYPLSYSYGKWTSGLNYVASGANVILHAKDATGATAQTATFQYLVNQAPLTDASKITPSTSSTCQPLARGMLSLTMDDSYPTQWTLAAPVMAKYGMKATIYNITHTLYDYGWLGSAQSLANAGHEVGSHTVDHFDMTGLTVANMDYELGTSQTYLKANVGSPADSFATPMGSYNATVLTEIKKYYASHRTVNAGLNYIGSSVYELNSDGAYGSITPATICAGLQDAAKYRGWRILMFHDFTTASTSNNDLLYTVADFESILKCAQQTAGLDVVTVHDGANAIRCASP